MRSWDFYDKLSELNDNLYTGAKDFGDWKIIETHEGSKGLYVALYNLGNNETLFAIRGTDFSSLKDSWEDLKADIVLWAKKYTGQFDAACQYYESIKSSSQAILLAVV